MVKSVWTETPLFEANGAVALASRCIAHQPLQLSCSYFDMLCIRVLRILHPKHMHVAITILSHHPYFYEGPFASWALNQYSYL